MSVSLHTPPNSVNLSKNPVRVRLYSTGYSLLDNYRTVLKLEFEKTLFAGDFVQVFAGDAVPDSLGYTYFDLQSILQAEMERNAPLQIPTIENQKAYTSDTLRRFRLVMLEKFGNPPTEKIETQQTSPVYQVLLGGVDGQYFGTFDFFENITSDNALLTYNPSGKWISKVQPEYINWLNYKGSNQQPYVAVWQFNDVGAPIGGATLVHAGQLGSDDPTTVAPWQIAVLPISPALVGISPDAVKMQVSVHVGTYGLTSRSSQFLTYYFHQNHQYEPADLIWYNAFRVPQILRCAGRRRTRLQVDRQYSQHIGTWGNDTNALAVLQHDKDFSSQHTYRTGAIRIGDADALQEMLAENTLFDHADGNYYRLKLTENSYDISETRIAPSYLEFSAVRAATPGNYMRTASPLLGGVEEGGLWQTNSGGFWELNTGGFFQTS